MTRVAVLLLDRVHLLDLAGPVQVFDGATELGLDHEISYVAETPRVTSAQGLVLEASTELPELGPDDVLLVPGRRDHAGAPPLLPATAGWLRRHRGTVASVCSGAEALARAGLLDGRRATTHHDLQDGLARRFPAVTVVRDVLYVVDGPVVTSAGIASGIDMALHLVATRHGAAAAARVARAMVVYARRNGDAPQASALLRHRGHVDDVVHRVQDVIEQRLAEPLTLARLSAECGWSERTLTRAFVRATGLTPLRYQQELRVERAEHLTGRGATAEAAAREVGFADGRMLRRLRARSAG